MAKRSDVSHNRSVKKSSSKQARKRRLYTLAEGFPDLAAEWHPTKNGDLTPSDVSWLSGKAVWWQCRVDPEHAFRRVIQGRATSKNSRCPLCHSLAARYPELAAEWHPTKNGKLTPHDVAGLSGKAVWWRCQRNPQHVWRRGVQTRVTRRSGCPFCVSLATVRPDLAREWHPKLNGGTKPTDVRVGSGRKIWWRCQRSSKHVWQHTVYDRVQGNGRCPVCASIATTHASLLTEWHPKKNGRLKPEDVTHGSARKVWWMCRKNRTHVWQGAVNLRARGNGCPFCARRVVSKETSLATMYPGLAAEWHPSKNGKLTPHDVTGSTTRAVWWQCRRESSHVWRNKIRARARGDREQACPFCSNRRVSKTNSLATMNPVLAKEWHPGKNGALTPHDVVPGSARRVWWKCAAGPDHEWQQQVGVRAVRQVGCPFCANHRVSVTNSLAARCPELAAQWDKKRNGARKPTHVLARSDEVVWWKCKVASDHVWQASPRQRLSDRGILKPCPFCSGLALSVSNALATVAPKLAAQWHPRNKLRPSEVIGTSTTPVWWRCARGHAWRQAPAVRLQEGPWCRRCAAMALAASAAVRRAG